MQFLTGLCLLLAGGSVVNGAGELNPTAPSHLKAVAPSSGEVDLTWIDEMKNSKTGFTIERSIPSVS